MRKVLSLFLCLLFVGPSKAQLTVTGVGGGFGAAAPTYTGPGDIFGSAVSWVGLRAYSSAQCTGSVNSVRIRRASDSTETNIVILADCNFDTATASTFCNATTCTVITWYDQTGNGRDFSTGSGIGGGTLTFSGLGSFPVVQFTAGGGLQATSLGGNVAQPWSVSTVIKQRTTGAQFYFGNSGAWGSFESDGADTTSIYANSPNLAAAATENVYHSIIAIGSGASSSISINGSTTSGSTGTNAIATDSGVGVAPNQGYGDTDIVEFGIWASAASGGQISSLSSNQQAYWGY